MGTDHLRRIAIMAHVVYDEIVTADGHSLRTVGGAGAFAAVGASLAGGGCSPAVVCGVGAADESELRRWLDERQVDSSGLYVLGELSPVTHIVYDGSGERTETPAFGLAHFESMGPSAAVIPWPVAEIAGVYVFRGLDRGFWDPMIDFMRRVPGPALWEIAADACVPGNEQLIRSLTSCVDLFSINLTESRSLFSLSAIDDIIKRFAAWPVPVLLRAGADGSFIVSATAATHVPAVAIDVLDPTGGGNSYSGAFLARYALCGDLLDSACVAAAAAATVIGEQGAPEVDDDIRAHVADVARQLRARAAAQIEGA